DNRLARVLLPDRQEPMSALVRPRDRIDFKEAVAEEGIHEMDNAGDAPEVLGELEPALRGEFSAPLLEDRRLGPTESINGLLHVPDHEQPAREKLGAGEQPEDLTLDDVGILELVDEDELEERGIACGAGEHAFRMVANQIARPD